MKLLVDMKTTKMINMTTTIEEFEYGQKKDLKAYVVPEQEKWGVSGNIEPIKKWLAMTENTRHQNIGEESSGHKETASSF